jgi:hypothetical protein
MGSFCALVLGGILGYSAASAVATSTIAELKATIARGEKIRKERDNGSPETQVSAK